MTNWVFDELFISARARELIERSDINGIDFWNVKIKSGKELLPDIF